MGESAAGAERPRGREEVTAAIVGAAGRLFAEHGPNRVSLRQIAADAGVNYGLVHRHFGTRKAVLRAVFDRAAERGLALLTPDASFGEALRVTYENASTGIGRTIAWAVLEGVDPHELHETFPTLHRLLDLAGTTPAGGPGDARDVSSRAVVAVLVAAALGWRVFEPFVVAGLGLDDIRPQALDNAVGEAFHTLGEGAVGASLRSRKRGRPPR